MARYHRLYNPYNQFHVAIVRSVEEQHGEQVHLPLHRIHKRSMAARRIRPQHVKEIGKARPSNGVVCFNTAEFLPVVIPTAIVASSEIGVELCQAVCQYLVITMLVRCLRGTYICRAGR